MSMTAAATATAAAIIAFVVAFKTTLLPFRNYGGSVRGAPGRALRAHAGRGRRPFKIHEKRPARMSPAGARARSVSAPRGRLRLRLTRWPRLRRGLRDRRQ